MKIGWRECILPAGMPLRCLFEICPFVVDSDGRHESRSAAVTGRPRQMKIAFQFSCTGPVPLRCLFEIYALWNRPRIMRKVFRRRRTDRLDGPGPAAAAGPGSRMPACVRHPRLCVGTCLLSTAQHSARRCRSDKVSVLLTRIMPGRPEPRARATET